MPGGDFLSNTVLDWLIKLANDAVVMAEAVVNAFQMPLIELFSPLFESDPVRGPIWRAVISGFLSFFTWLTDIEIPTLSHVLIGGGFTLIISLLVIKWIIGIFT